MTIFVAEATGIDPIKFLIPEFYDILWSAVVFIGLLIFFWKFAIPIITKITDDRAQAIEGGIEKAEAAQAEAAQALDEYSQLLADARTEAAQIRDQARLDGTKILNEQKTHATQEADRILANAQLQIEAERQSALVSLRAEVGSLALSLASGVLGESLNDDKKAQGVVDRFLSDLTSSDQKAGK